MNFRIIMRALYRALLILAVCLLGPLHAHSADTVGKPAFSDNDLESIGELEGKLQNCQQRYEKLKGAGYGGQALGADLANLSSQVSAILKDLESISQLNKVPEPLAFLEARLYDSLDTRNEISRIKIGEPFIILATVKNLPPESAKKMEYCFEVEDADTGNHIQDIEDGLRWKYEEKTGNTLLLRSFPNGFSQAATYDFRLFILPEGMDVAETEHLYLEVGSDLEALTLTLPSSIKENEPVSIGYTLPEGFSPPYTMRLVNRAPKARNNGFGRELEHHDFQNEFKVHIKTLTLDMDIKHSGMVLDGVDVLPATFQCRNAGSSHLEITLTDAGGRTARGSAPLFVTGVPPALEALRLVDEKGKELARIRAGDYLGVDAEYTKGSAVKEALYLQVQVHDGDGGDLIVQDTFPLNMNPFHVDFKEFSWMGASAIVVTSRLENKDGKVFDEKRASLQVKQEKLRILAPSAITAIQKTPFSIQLPGHFEPPFKWVRNTSNAIIGAWPLSAEKGGGVMEGTEGILFGFARGEAGDGEISIAVKDARGRVAVGSKSIHVELNPEAEKGVFDDLAQTLGGIGNGLAVAAGAFADAGGTGEGHDFSSLGIVPLSESPSDSGSSPLSNIGDDAVSKGESGPPLSKHLNRNCSPMSAQLSSKVLARLQRLYGNAEKPLEKLLSAGDCNCLQWLGEYERYILQSMERMQEINTHYVTTVKANDLWGTDEHVRLNDARMENWDELFDSEREALEDKAGGYAHRISQGAGETMASLREVIWNVYYRTIYELGQKPHLKRQL